MASPNIYNPNNADLVKISRLNLVILASKMKKNRIDYKFNNKFRNEQALIHHFDIKAAYNIVL